MTVGRSEAASEKNIGPTKFPLAKFAWPFGVHPEGLTDKIRPRGEIAVEIEIASKTESSCNSL